MPAQAIPEQATKQLFTEARTHSFWLPGPVGDDVLKKLYDLVKFGPTSANCCPLRIVFVKSKEAKEKLKPCLSPGNVEKTMSAPVTAILAQDMEFYNHMPKLFPHTDAKSWFVGNEKMITDTAILNSSLEAGYFILAARGLGLDCGPMSGFDKAKTDAAFFVGTPYKSLMLCNLGHGDAAQLHPRSPRFDFEEVCKIV